MARPLNPNPTRFKLRVGSRDKNLLVTTGQSPSKSSPQDVRISYHHIIPLDELIEFWNISVKHDLEQLRETLIPVLMQTVAKYPYLRDKPQEAGDLVHSVTTLLQNIWAGNYIHAEVPISPPGINDLSNAYHWIPGNIFPGPANRANEPKNRFDSFASRCIEERRYLDALQAHNAIQAYLDGHPERDFPANPSGTRARAFAGRSAHTAGMALARVAAHIDLPEYQESAWRAMVK